MRCKSVYGNIFGNFTKKQKAFLNFNKKIKQ